MGQFSFGTEQFMKSVNTISINYQQVLDMPDIQNDIDTLLEHFKNTTTFDLWNFCFVSFKQIYKILMSHRINQISFNGDGYEDNDEYMIESQAGCMLFYDNDEKHYVNFRNLNLKSDSSHYISQNDYVIFTNESVSLKFDYEGMVESCNDYACIELENIDKPVIIMHRKYIHNLYIHKDLYNEIDFEPTKILQLNFGKDFRFQEG